MWSPALKVEREEKKKHSKHQISHAEWKPPGWDSGTTGRVRWEPGRVFSRVQESVAVQNIGMLQLPERTAQIHKTGESGGRRDGREGVKEAQRISAQDYNQGRSFIHEGWGEGKGGENKFQKCNAEQQHCYQGEA